jgi:AraC family transcriptional regulator
MAGLLTALALPHVTHVLDTSPAAAVTISEVRSPAHECRSPGTEDLSVVAVVEHYHGAAHYDVGDGLKPTTCLKYRPVIVLPADCASRWVVEGKTRTVILSMHNPGMSAIFDELEIPDVSNGLGALAEAGCFSGPFLYDLVMRLWSLAQARSITSRLLVESHQVLVAHALSEAWTSQIGRAQASSPLLSRSKLKTVLEFIEAHLTQDVSLEQLAGLCNMSRFHFLRIFKQYTGLPPYQYLITRRIDIAKTLLTTTDESIGTIAARVGFADQSGLNRHFKRLVGRTPRAYRSLPLRTT